MNDTHIFNVNFFFTDLASGFEKILLLSYTVEGFLINNSI